MKVSLKSYFVNYPVGIPIKAILIVVFLLLVNSYIIVNYLIPSDFLNQIKILTHGILTPVFISFSFSTLLYTLVFKYLRQTDKAYDFNQHKLTSYITIAVFVVLFSLIVIPFFDHENSNKHMGIGYFLELMSGAICEEVTFRLFILAGLIQFLKPQIGAYSIWTSIILSSIIFSALHLFDQLRHGTVTIQFYIMAALIGWLLSWVYIWFNNLTLVIFLHFLFNLVMLYFPLDPAGIGIGILLWFIGVSILAIKGYDISDPNKWS